MLRYVTPLAQDSQGKSTGLGCYGLCLTAVTLSSGPQFTHLSEGYHGNPLDFLRCCGQELAKTMSNVVIGKKPEDNEGQGREGDGYR